MKSKQDEITTRVVLQSNQAFWKTALVQDSCIIEK